MKLYVKSVTLLTFALIISGFYFSAANGQQKQSDIDNDNKIIFVSIKSDNARMRVGPGTDYPVKWIYKRKGWPLERLQSFGNWRLVRDVEGDEGWMHSSLLSVKRFGIIPPWHKGANVTVYNGKEGNATKEVAVLMANVVVRISSCDGAWCDIATTDNKYSGWIRQDSVWGVAKDEVFKSY